MKKKFFVHTSKKQMNCTNCENVIRAGIAFLRFSYYEGTRWSIAGNLCPECFKKFEMNINIKKKNLSM